MTDYIAQYRKMHREQKNFPGWRIRKYTPEIKRLVEKTDSKYLLDYGCGKGLQYIVKRCHEHWGVPVPYCYDPGIEALATKPDRLSNFDGVVCVDVLEHIPERDITFTLEELRSYGQKFVFMSIATYPSKKVLPNREPCHVTVKPREWWDRKITAAFWGSYAIVEVAYS